MDMTWAVKNVKTRTGREGPGFSCTLYYGGTRWATVDDWGDGGSVEFDWLSPTREDRIAKEKAFKEYCESLPSYRPDWLPEHESDMTETPDTVVSGMADDYLNEQRLRRFCKTKVLFRIEGDPEGSWRTLLCPFTQKAVDQIRRKYGEEAVILNYRYGGVQ